MSTKIKVEDLYIRFNLASERVDNLKEYVIKIAKKQLLFQEFMALKGVSFEVHEGEILGLLRTKWKW